MVGINDTAHDRVVELYQAGERIEQITAATGYQRPAIYWILKKRGITPTRQKKATDTNDTISAAELLEQLQAAQRQIGRLDAEVVRLRQLLSDVGAQHSQP